MPRSCACAKVSECALHFENMSLTNLNGDHFGEEISTLALHFLNGDRLLLVAADLFVQARNLRLSTN